MNTSQLASLVDVAIPLLAGALLLAKPSLFTKKDLNAPENAGLKKRLSLAGILALVAAALVFVSHAASSQNPTEVSTETFLAMVVVQTNRQLPRMIDEYTSLERVSASDHTLIYHYRLHDLDTSRLSADAIAAAMKPAAIAQFQKNPNVKTFKARNIHVRHYYETDDHSFTVVIALTPQDYP